MPFPFQVILIAGATGYLLTALLFLMTRTMPRTNPGAGWWALASLAAGVGYIALLALGLAGRPQLGEALYNMLFVLWATGLYIGGCLFLGRRVSVPALLAVAAAVVAWLYHFYFIQPAFLPAAIVVSLYCGVLNLRLGWLFARKIGQHSVFTRLLVAMLAISGIHWLDYPLLRPVEAFAPIGFSLCAIISVIISSLLAGMVLRQFRLRVSASEAAALQAATHDPLTGLQNRLALESQFSLVLSQSRRTGEGLAMLFLDLDGFKAVNDRFGHTKGDQVLATMAQRLGSVVRKSDIVARVGGDEFAVILTGLPDEGRALAEQVAEKIIDTIREPVSIDGEPYRMSTSIGIAYCPSQAEDLALLMNLADEAMYSAKHAGKSRYVQAVAQQPAPA